MRSTITKDGQTMVPAKVRRQFHLSPADRLEWVVDSQGIRVVPVQANPISEFRGQGMGGSTQRLLQDRAVPVSDTVSVIR
jgi:AbrB family looped-hinge helix DNA binding protein